MRAPKIEFPCDYPIKVLGAQDDTFARDVVEIIRKYDPEAVVAATRQSQRGKYVAVTVTITATGEEQIKAIFQDLQKDGRVRYVL